MPKKKIMGATGIARLYMRVKELIFATAALKADKTLANVEAGDFKKLAVSADGYTTGGSGTTYTVTVPGVTALKSGLSLTIIPHTVSTTATPSLNVNSLGAKTLVMPVGSSTGSTMAPNLASWLTANKPIQVMYNGAQWVVVSMPGVDVNKVTGTLKVANGGTGATTAAKARENLGITPANIGALTNDDIKDLYGPNNKPTASDVGAIPASEKSSLYGTHNKPTASDVGAIPASDKANLYGTHNKPTASDVGAIPASDKANLYGTHNKPTASDVGAIPTSERNNLLDNSGDQTITNGGLVLDDKNSVGKSLTIKRLVNGAEHVVTLWPNADGDLFLRLDGDGTVLNGLLLGPDNSHLTKPLTISSGGTGATTAEEARTKLGINPATIGAISKNGGMVSGEFLVQRSFTDGGGHVVRTNLYPTNYALNNNYVSSIIHHRDGSDRAAIAFNESGAVLRDLVNSKDYDLYGEHNMPSIGNLGGVDVIEANTADYDMDAILTGGAHFRIYKTGAKTLNTPYAKGDSTYNSAIIISFASSTSYGRQLALITGATRMMERRLNGGVIGDWVAIHNGSETITVSKGGTGATTAADARTNLGFGATKSLYNGTLSTGSITFEYGPYSAYIVYLRPADGMARMATIIAKGYIPTGSITLNTANTANNLAFNVSYSGSKVTLTIHDNKGNGNITNVFGVY